MLSESMDRLFDLYRQTGNETHRAIGFRRSSQEKLKSILDRMGGEEQVIAAIIQPVFAALTLSQDSGTTDEFIPALALNGPRGSLASIVHELLQAFCDYLVATEVHIRATVAERENSNGEPCLGLVRIPTS